MSRSPLDTRASTLSADSEELNDVNRAIQSSSVSASNAANRTRVKRICTELKNRGKGGICGSTAQKDDKFNVDRCNGHRKCFSCERFSYKGEKQCKYCQALSINIPEASARNHRDSQHWDRQRRAKAPAQEMQSKSSSSIVSQSSLLPPGLFSHRHDHDRCTKPKLDTAAATAAIGYGETLPDTSFYASSDQDDSEPETILPPRLNHTIRKVSTRKKSLRCSQNNQESHQRHHQQGLSKVPHSPTLMPIPTPSSPRGAPASKNPLLHLKNGLRRVSNGKSAPGPSKIPTPHPAPYVSDFTVQHALSTDLEQVCERKLMPLRAEIQDLRHARSMAEGALALKGTVERLDDVVEGLKRVLEGLEVGERGNASGRSGGVGPAEVERGRWPSGRRVSGHWWAKPGDDDGEEEL